MVPPLQRGGDSEGRFRTETTVLGVEVVSAASVGWLLRTVNRKLISQARNSYELLAPKYLTLNLGKCLLRKASRRTGLHNDR